MTVKQIATDLELDRTTVSIILNGNHQRRSLAPATVKKVQDYVKKIGFYQDIGALAMRGKYSNDVVIVSRRRMTHELRQVYFRLINHLEKLGISHVTIFYADDGIPQMIKEIEFFNPRRIIVFSVLTPGMHDEWRMLRKDHCSEIPCFFFDSIQGESLLFDAGDGIAEMDRLNVFKKITATLSDGGFTDIFVPHGHFIAKNIKNPGIKITELDSWRTIDFAEPENAFHTAGLLDVGKDYAGQILEKSFTKGKAAAFFGDDFVCCGAIRHLQENKVKVPEDIEIFSFGYMAENQMLKYSFTSWQFPYDAMYNKMMRWVKDGGSGEKNKLFRIKKVITGI